MDSPYVTVIEAARYLRVDPATVRRLCSDGALPAMKVGKLYRIKRTDLDRLGAQ